ncbi:alpha/beta hydrolase [Membranihabitans maritimus]|uniref:alpha/beta hydrolase n=1 Tax=Membranihabitans maritimus TaxID=2904244 RepID=UPI001F36164E|nr:alpha/beta hydrolase [Membranihabitans maritimus]
METKKSKTIILIHGNFVNNETWKDWKTYLEEKGYNVYTPANPGHKGKPADLRKNPPSTLPRTDFKDVINNISNLIDSLPEKPLVIGHSMAGMAVLKLTALNKVAAAVSIDGAPPKNVTPPLSTIKMVWGGFGFFTSKKYYMGTEKWYNKAFFNTLSRKEQKKMFEHYAVPESFKVSRQLVFDKYTKIDFKKPHTPILFIGGKSDHIFPPKLTKKIARKYKDKNSHVDVKIYHGKSHFICGQTGWEQIADDIINWYENL